MVLMVCNCSSGTSHSRIFSRFALNSPPSRTTNSRLIYKCFYCYLIICLHHESALQFFCKTHVPIKNGQKKCQKKTARCKIDSSKFYVSKCAENCHAVYIYTSRSCSKLLVSCSNVHLLMELAAFNWSMLLPIIMKASQ